MRVDVSPDGGRRWAQADFDPHDDVDHQPYAWRRWRVRIPGVNGKCIVLARATDAGGQVQPLTPELNAAGYGNNACHLVTVYADG